jgi:hypothetical protein
MMKNKTRFPVGIRLFKKINKKKTSNLFRNANEDIVKKENIGTNDRK